MRKTCGIAQLAQKELRKTKISFHAQLSQKVFPVLRKKIAQNSLRFMRKNSAKVRKKNLRENSAKDLAISWKP